MWTFSLSYACKNDSTDDVNKVNYSIYDGRIPVVCHKNSSHLSWGVSHVDIRKTKLYDLI